MGNKTSQLQIRVSPAQKAALKRLAAAEGLSVSQYVLTNVLPSSRAEFARLAGALDLRLSRPAALKALRAYLSALGAEDLREAVADLDLTGLSSVVQNYVAAAVEELVLDAGIDLPAWIRAVSALNRPDFAWGARSLRPHLMRITPLAFKRRNVFVDAAGVEATLGTSDG